MASTPSEANSTAVARLVAENSRRADLVRCEELGELVLVHRLGEVGDVEVRVVFVGKGLELGVERLAGEADFVAKVVEATDAVLGVLVVVVLDKAETERVSVEARTAVRYEQQLTPCTG